MTRLAQAKVERGGWYEGKWISAEDRKAAEGRWVGRSYKFRHGGCEWHSVLAENRGAA